MGRREGLPRRRPHPGSAGRTVTRRDQGETSQMVRKLPIPLYERFSSPGARVYDLQDRIWCGLSEAVGQEGVVPSWVSLYWHANQGPHPSIPFRIFCDSLYAPHTRKHRPLQTRSSARWRCSGRTLKTTARKKTNLPLLPRKARLLARPPKASCKPSRLAIRTSSRSWNLSGYHYRRSKSSPIRIIGWNTSHRSPS